MDDRKNKEREKRMTMLLAVIIILMCLTVYIIIETAFGTRDFFHDEPVEETETTEESGAEYAAPVAVLDRTSVFAGAGHEEQETEDSIAETEAETETAAEPAIAPAPKVTVEGHEFYLSTFLYNTLLSYGIEDWYGTALLQIYQESHFDPFAVSTDGLDKGILQYRERYWESDYASPAGFSGADIYDPYVQIAVYAYHTARRIDSGMSREEIISAHFTGGIGYSEEYVRDVLRWEQTEVFYADDDLQM